ncbi:melanopsin-like isoform X1 [Montipora capricornis]|uniref:melanopsin-like isoform X1 n=2 Tax=Montipora capricornis TaxID=246305 RepID=UPI0035F10968
MQDDQSLIQIMPEAQNKSEELQHTESISTHARFIIAGVYALLAIIAIGLNTPVLLTFFKDPRPRVPSNKLILSITVGDWLHAVLAYPVGVIANASQSSRGLSGIACTWYGFITVFLSFGVILHHATFAIERAIVIQYATTSWTNARTLHFVITALWGFALMWSSFPLFGWSAYVPDVVLCTLHWQSDDLLDRAFVYCIFSLFFFVPILIMVTSYCKIFRNVKKMTQNARDLWGEKAFPTQEAIQSQKKVARMAFIMSICFLFAWTPYAAVSLYAFFWKPKRMTPYVSIIPALFAKTSACFNPVIYFMLLKTFRESLRKTIQPLCGIFMSTGNPTNIEMKNSIYSSLENKNDDKL